MPVPCSHLDQIRDVTPQTEGCEECLAEGCDWTNLRICMTCGHVGCCETSAGKHAEAHFLATGHPIMKSFDTGEDWGWCFIDKQPLPDLSAASPALRNAT